MIKYSVTYEDVHETGKIYDSIEIPAYIQNNALHIGHNGESREILKYVKYPEDFDISKLNHWIDRYFVYDNKEIWQLTSVIGSSSNKVLCSYLRRSPQGTFLCKCRDCGEKYVIDTYESSWYFGRNMKLPKRCKSCRDKQRTINKF